ncbi:unnamed protein product [Leptosia nina]|uniref:Retrotransposon gag domain-containing protein n=1 Tax=Leptosia nina TaxID=320188 RepID=A0AAV1J789_9NEOP
MSNPKVDAKPQELVSLPTLLQLIPDFRTELNSEVYRFIRSCDSAFNLATIQQQELLLVYALNKITGPSSSEIHAKKYKNWVELKTYLIQRFSQTKTLGHLNLELQTMFQKPNETVTEYYHRVDLCRNKILEKLTTEITDDSLIGRKLTAEETALNVFINGLSSDIGVMLRTREFSNINDAGNFAMQEEKIRRMNKARQALIPNTRPPVRNYPIPRPSPKFSEQRVPHITSTPQYTLKFCNYCKNKGHNISECRKRQFNNNRHTFNTQNSQNIHVNHLNSQTAEETSESSETVSIPCTLAQVHVSNPGNQELENIQFQ